MRRWLTGSLLAMGASLFAAPPEYVVGQQPPQFRTAVTGASVPVLVRSDRRIVTGLTTDDFVLTDSGVRQVVTAVDGARVPLDISLVVEPTLRVEWLETTNFRAEIEAVRRLLAPNERLRVVSAGAGGSGTARSCHTLYDAVSRVLMAPVAPGRQHFVLVLTSGEGGGSVISSDVAAAIARRSDAVMSVFMWEPRWVGAVVTITRQWVRRPMCAQSGLEWTTERHDRLRQIAGLSSTVDQTRALYQDERARLGRLAASTGGTEIRLGVFNRSIDGPLRQALEEARARYVLYYTPTGVPAMGWHPIEVTVTRPGRYDVRARPGYER